MQKDQQPHLIVIAGPTAAGKTAFAIEVARHFNTEIISADSRQCYRELDIGVARPSPEELAAVPHHFIASHSIQDPLNAAWYEQYALQLLEQLFLHHRIAVVAGGTGLYIKALLEGLDAIPGIPPGVRAEVTAIYEAQGLEGLYHILEQQQDPFLQVGELQNPQRLMRAAEVLLHTGKSIISYKTQQKARRNFTYSFWGMQLPRAFLYERINQRVDRMMAEGLEQEVAALLPYQHLNALQTVGYSELFDYFNGNISKEAAVALIQQNTRRYAKRQVTWFNKQEGLQWLDAARADNLDIVAKAVQVMRG